MSSPEARVQKPRPRRSTRKWLAESTKAVAILLAVYLALQWFSGHYRIAYDSIKGANCLPYSVFIVDLQEKKVSRGDFVAFVSRQMEPFYRNGTVAVKLLSGVPGDRITVDRQGVAINGRRYGELFHAREGGKLWKLGRRLTDYFRDENVPAHHFWMMGTYPRSYDSRYWGYISDDQILGRAIPLW